MRLSLLSEVLGVACTNALEIGIDIGRSSTVFCSSFLPDSTMTEELRFGLHDLFGISRQRGISPQLC